MEGDVKPHPRFLGELDGRLYFIIDPRFYGIIKSELKKRTNRGR